MISSKMSVKEASGCARRLGIGFKAGLDLLRLLDTEKSNGSTLYREKIGNVANSIRQGKTFAESMIAEGKYFPPLFIQLVHAGETAGGLDTILLHLADYYDELRRTRSSFLQRIAWPCLQLVMAVGVIGLVILIQGILSSSPSGPAYDATTLGLSGLGGFVVYCIVVSLFFGTIGLTIYGVIQNWFNSQSILFPLIQKIPVVGTPLQTLSLARFTMTLSLLLNAGVDAIRSVKQAFRSTGNYYLMGGMDKSLEAIKRGESFGQAFREAGVFPTDFLEYVEIGEMSGTETESLDRLAATYQERGKVALVALAMAASGLIWLFVTAMIIFMIMRMAMQYINLLNNPMG